MEGETEIIIESIKVGRREEGREERRVEGSRGRNFLSSMFNSDLCESSPKKNNGESFGSTLGDLSVDKIEASGMYR